MMNPSKIQQLKMVIAQGLCPICLSEEMKYIQYAKGQFFLFECRQCPWHSFYSRGGFQQASSS